MSNFESTDFGKGKSWCHPQNAYSATSSHSVATKMLHSLDIRTQNET